jgi:regulator of protease activity HflC (stomatin/prohibitin superfamily)
MSTTAIVLVVLVVIVLLATLRLCNEWQRKVVLRLGRFVGVRGPGLFFLVPFVETTPFTIDMRVNTSSFTAEQTLTKDGASVTVDSLVYWRVVDAGRASIQVNNYTQAVIGSAQGGLRDIIGRNDLATLLSQRRELDAQLATILDEQTEAWGIKVESVQLRDIKVPDNLKDALSRMAQAERERQARVILGESELRIAQLFADAGAQYSQNPTALHLRGMNMLYETMRSGVGTVIVVPSSALDSMNLGTIGGINALGTMGRPATPVPGLSGDSNDAGQGGETRPRPTRPPMPDSLAPPISSSVPGSSPPGPLEPGGTLPLA